MRAYDGERKITRQLTQYNSNGSDWANIARDAFDFALLAKQRFKHGDSVDKKVVFKAIGVNPILLNQKLEYQPRFIFLKIKEGVKKTNDRTGQLESRKSPSNQANLENYLKSSVWCRREDLNLHGFPHTVLSRACIPISTLRQILN